MTLSKDYPCDHFGHCPFDATYGSDCRNQCGLGVDEDAPEEMSLDDVEYLLTQHEVERYYLHKSGADVQDRVIY